MTDVFISYKKEERERCERIAAKLRGLGLDVWFDVKLETGTEFPVEIQKAVTSAKAVLVLWSRASIKSSWVRNEARRGMTANKLVAATLEPIPAGELPVEFDGIHFEALHDPNFQDDDAPWLKVVERIAKLTNRPSIVSFSRALAQAAIPLEQWAKQNASDPLAKQMATKAALLGGVDPAHAAPKPRGMFATVAAAALLCLAIGGGAGWFASQSMGAAEATPSPGLVTPAPVVEPTLQEQASALVGRYSLNSDRTCANRRQVLVVWLGYSDPPAGSSGPSPMLRMMNETVEVASYRVDSWDGEWIVAVDATNTPFRFKRDAEGLARQNDPTLEACAT